MSLLWLLPKGKPDNRRKYAAALLKSQNVPLTSVTFTAIHKYDDKLWTKTSQRKWEIAPAKQLSAMKLITRMVENAAPTCVVINDVASAQLLFPSTFRNAQTLEKYRGSVYYHSSFPNVPFIVIDDMFKCYAPDFGAKTPPQIYAFIAAHDVQKAARYYNNTIRHFPDFDYELVTDAFDLQQIVDHFLTNGIAYATDVETSISSISCVGLSILYRDGSCKTITVPFLTGAEPEVNYHSDFDNELSLWKQLKRILESGIPAAMHNGRYDLDYFIKYNLRPRNAFYDTQLMMHSISGRIPKSLAFTASLYADNYYFWKDESKGDNATKDKKWALPKTHNGMRMYYEYCGRDCYYTLQCFIHLLPQIAATPWMLRNFAITVQQQYGPAYEMSTRGFAVNKARKAKMEQILAQKTFAAMMKFKTACDDMDINPNSPPQVMNLFYDILGTPIVGKRRSSNKDVLRRATFRSTMADAMFRLLRDVKDSGKLHTTLRNWKLKHDRSFATFNASGTWTGRYSSKGHNWWVGSNLQNVNKGLRPFMVADKGYVLVGIDYSQSDGYFVAYESQDPDYINVMKRNMEEGYDTHSHHVQLMFGTPYDVVMKGKRTKDPAIVHPVTGQRQIIKKVVHGTNYGMKEETMLTNTGVEPLMAAAEILGFKTARRWGDDRVKQIVAFLQSKYHKAYPRVTTWGNNIAKDTADNRNLIKAYGGRTHCAIGNLRNDRGGNFARMLTAYKGQGGTAGNINRTLQEIYFNSDLPSRGVQLVAQVHDEIIFQVPEQQLNLIDYILKIMEKPITINNRTFYVPAEAEIGYSWQVYVDYDSNKSNEEHLVALRQAEAKYEEKLSKGKL